MRRKVIASFATAVLTAISLAVSASPAAATAIDPYPSSDPVTGCAFGPLGRPGVIEFRDMVLARIGGGHGGIYDCRYIDNTTQWSDHADGRAWDWMMSAFDSTEVAKVSTVLTWLTRTDESGNTHAMARRLGIRYVIWNRQKISFSSASATWQPYLGPSNPHTNHVHFSFSLAGANQQTTWFTTNPKPANWYPSLFTPESDYNGDRTSDMMFFRPANGSWNVLNTGGSAQVLTSQWGGPGDTALNGDYNGDGKADMMIFRPSDGSWSVRYAGGSTHFLLSQWGGPGDVPLDGDYNGDGKADMMIFRPSTGEWLVWYTGGGWALLTSSWGSAGDIPFSGDYNGDGKADMMIFRPSDGSWSVRYADGSTHFLLSQWGGAGDVALDGDYNGDGRADMMIFRPSTGQWLVWYTGGGWAQLNGSQWGGADDVPLDGDYNGDGKADMMIFRPSTGEWLVWYTGGWWAVLTANWGGQGDVVM